VIPLFHMISFANRTCCKNCGQSRGVTLKTQATQNSVNYITYFQNFATLSEVNRIIIVSRKFFHYLKSEKMNTTELKGNWNEQKGKLKKKFAVLTDNDLMFEEGKKDEMFGKLQIILGKSKEEFDKIISSL
jgi:uncharacterized protein YjbJ (UPF0337 family)